MEGQADPKPSLSGPRPGLLRPTWVPHQLPLPGAPTGAVLAPQTPFSKTQVCDVCDGYGATAGVPRGLCCVSSPVQVAGLFGQVTRSTNHAARSCAQNLASGDKQPGCPDSGK